MPIAVAAEWFHASALAVFALSALATLPLSALLGRATEELSARAGPTIGGLLNATLGNLAELIIAAFALRAGLIGLVKASITGSILGNLLLVLGAAQLVGGLRYQTQVFNRQLVTVNVPLLVIAATGLVLPALFHAAHPDPARVATVRMSEFVAVLLILGYVLHRHGVVQREAIDVRGSAFFDPMIQRIDGDALTEVLNDSRAAGDRPFREHTCSLDRRLAEANKVPVRRIELWHGSPALKGWANMPPTEGGRQRSGLHPISALSSMTPLTASQRP
jgi:Ca2+/Na+ antiporter